MSAYTNSAGHGMAPLGMVRSLLRLTFRSVTPRVLANMRKEIEDVANELDGFEDLEPTDQEKVMAAFALGQVREQDTTPALLNEETTEVPTRAGTKRSRSEKKHDDEDVQYESDDDHDAKAPEFIENLPSKRARKPTQRYGASSTRPKAEDAAGGEDDNEEEEEEEEEEDSDDSDLFEQDEDDEEDDEEEDYEEEED